VADDPVGREIRQLREDLRDDIAQLRSELDRRVLREVHSAEYKSLEARLSALEREVEAAETKQVGQRRWLVSAVVLPVIALIVTIVLAVTRP